MRTFLLLLFTTLISVTESFAQTGAQAHEAEAQRENPVDRMLNVPGNIFRKEFTDIAEIKKIKIRLVKITSLKDEKLQFNKAYISYEYHGTDIPDTKSVVIDATTAEDLSANFTEIQSKVLSKPASSYTEVVFKTKNGIVAGAYWAKNTWAIFMRLINNDNESYVSFEKEDLGKLIAAFDQVKVKLAAAKP